jgi:epoxyqueuosine reductase
MEAVSLSPHAVVSRIKNRARELGFAACGIASAAPGETHGRYREWLAQGFNADMQWMAREDAVWKREDLTRVLPGCKSVICVALHYRTREEWNEEQHGKVARYARGLDYHDVMSTRLRALLAFIQELAPCNGRVYSDTGPLLEREIARRAGLGWFGKNSMILSRELGSYFLLGEILLDIELPADEPHVAQFCGSCTRCLDACPTQAIEAPGMLNASKCISFYSIENRGEAPPELSTHFGDWLFGCDICQEVCPWNRKSSENPDAFSGEPELWTRDEFPTLAEFLTLPQAAWSRRLKGSPLKRPKRRGMKKNALRVLRNRKTEKK